MSYGYYANFLKACNNLTSDVKNWGEVVDPGHWQGVSTKGQPSLVTKELSNVIFTVPVARFDMHGAELLEVLASEIQPNRDWADEHFQERVGGVPLNPDPSHERWPWWHGQDSAKTEGEQEQFTHTYSERFWPKKAGPMDGKLHKDPQAILDANDFDSVNIGIRYRYGDLDDVVALLAREPFTRQAYLPVWFPEDTGAHHGERVPCSLGYHFMLREGKLHCAYFIRSCDFLRHFRDDVYLTCRLVQWVLDQVKEEGFLVDKDPWQGVKPGMLTMFMHSLHVFEGDMPKMRKEFGYVPVRSTDE